MYESGSTGLLTGDRVEGRFLAGIVALADESPQAAREALWDLQSDPDRLGQIEAGLSGSEAQATLALGAAIQTARAELNSPSPDLRGRIPDLLRWLEAA